MRTNSNPTIIETGNKTFFFTINKREKKIIGKAPPSTIFKPFRGLALDLAELQVPLTTFKAGPGGGGSSAKCDTDRKAGWTASVGTVILGGLAAMAAPVVAVALVSAAVVGAMGGAAAAKVESDYKDCKEKAE